MKILIYLIIHYLSNGFCFSGLLYKNLGFLVFYNRQLKEVANLKNAVTNKIPNNQFDFILFPLASLNWFFLNRILYLRCFWFCRIKLKIKPAFVSVLWQLWSSANFCAFLSGPGRPGIFKPFWQVLETAWYSKCTKETSELKMASSLQVFNNCSWNE